MDLMEEVVLKFDGGLATRGQMHLYEYGRAQYGVSRVLTTIEQFRRTGSVIDKVSKTRKIDLIVSAPKEGTFQLDILVSVREAAEAFLKDVPFDVLFSLVLERLIPPGEEHEKLITNLGKIALAQLNALPNRNPDQEKWRDELSEIGAGALATPEQALRIVDYGLNTPNAAIGRAGIEYDEMRRAQLILASDAHRARTLAEHSEAIKKIDYGQLDKLVAKVRPMFNEVAVPLDRSANVITLGVSEDHERYYRFDRARLNLIQSRRLDETIVEIKVRIKSYDRENGNGRMRSDEFSGVKSFLVDPDVRSEVQPEIIAAMNRRDVVLKCARYTDSNGIVTSYIVRGVV